MVLKNIHFDGLTAQVLVISMAMVVGIAEPVWAAPKCMTLLQLARYDRNKDLGIDRSEYPAIVAARFATHDKDGNGSIFMSEIGAAPDDERFLHPEVRRFATRKNGKIWIERASWQAASKVLFKVMDTDSNNFLSIKEYRSFCNAGYRF